MTILREKVGYTFCCCKRFVFPAFKKSYRLCLSFSEILISSKAPNCVHPDFSKRHEVGRVVRALGKLLSTREASCDTYASLVLLKPPRCILNSKNDAYHEILASLATISLLVCPKSRDVSQEQRICAVRFSCF